MQNILLYFIHLYIQILFRQMKIEDAIKTSSIPKNTKTVINLAYTANYVSDKLNEAIKPYDISIQQFNVLRILRGQKGKPANLFTIQERMINKMSNTTRLIDKLILKNYVERKVCEKNRRKVEILITNEGLAALSKIDSLITSTEKEILKVLSEEEIESINQILDKLRQ